MFVRLGENVRDGENVRVRDGVSVSDGVKVCVRDGVSVRVNDGVLVLVGMVPVGVVDGVFVIDGVSVLERVYVRVLDGRIVAVITLRVADRIGVAINEGSGLLLMYSTMIYGNSVSQCCSYIVIAPLRLILAQPIPAPLNSSNITPSQNSIGDDKFAAVWVTTGMSRGKYPSNIRFDDSYGKLQYFDIVPILFWYVVLTPLIHANEFSMGAPATGVPYVRTNNCFKQVAIKSGCPFCSLYWLPSALIFASC